MPRADVIAHRSPSTPATLGYGYGHVPAPLKSVLVAVTRMWIARRDARTLMEMPDYLLKDVGIGRADIWRAVRYGSA